VQAQQSCIQKVSAIGQFTSADTLVRCSRQLVFAFLSVLVHPLLAERYDDFDNCIPATELTVFRFPDALWPTKRTESQHTSNRPSDLCPGARRQPLVRGEPVGAGCLAHLQTGDRNSDSCLSQFERGHITVRQDDAS
jgi:hypothetical protein